MAEVIVAGHLCLDIIPDLSGYEPGRLETILQPGQLIVVGPVEVCTGGTVSNTGLALVKLGVATGLMGKVGDDLFGHAIRRVIHDTVGPAGAGQADAMVIDPTVHSSYTIVINPPAVDRIFFHYPGANDTFGAGDVRYDLVAGARLFHFGYPPLMRRMYEAGGKELAAIFRRARETGATTSLDMALPDPASPAGRADWPAILGAVLPHVDLFTPSIEEMLSMLRPETFRALRAAAGGPDILPLVRPALLADLADELLALGARIVALKLGYRGLYLRTAGRQALEAMGRARPLDAAAWARRELWAPCFRVQVAGTTGSGDATTAGLIGGLLHGLGPEEAVTAAVAVGACNVEAADALGGIRSWDETWQRVRAGWTRHPLALDVPGWRLDEEHHVWVGPGSD